jgi:hypothetical protein
VLQQQLQPQQVVNGINIINNNNNPNSFMDNAISALSQVPINNPNALAQVPLINYNRGLEARLIPGTNLINYSNTPQQQQQQYINQQQNPTQLRLSSLTPQAVPYINGTARSVILQNDNIKVPQVKSVAVMPSLYWFKTRRAELSKGDIEYFIPRDAPCVKKQPFLFGFNSLFL